MFHLLIINDFFYQSGKMFENDHIRRCSIIIIIQLSSLIHLTTLQRKALLADWLAPNKAEIKLLVHH